MDCPAQASPVGAQTCPEVAWLRLWRVETALLMHADMEGSFMNGWMGERAEGKRGGGAQNVATVQWNWIACGEMCRRESTSCDFIATATTWTRGSSSNGGALRYFVAKINCPAAVKDLRCEQEEQNRHIWNAELEWDASMSTCISYKQLSSSTIIWALFQLV